MNPFEKIQLKPIEIKKSYDNNSEKNPFDKVAVDESWGKSIARTLYQIPSGIAQAVTYPLDLMQMLGAGDALDPEEIDHIKMISEREGIPFDEQKYVDAVQAASEAFPTQGNIERFVEKNTGAPLEPKTRLQKGLKFLSTASKFVPSGYSVRGINVGLPKPVLGAAVAGTKEVAQELGVPEPLAELGSFAILKKPPEGYPKISIGSEKKPSGLTTRRYESIKKPTEVSSTRLKKINEKVEGEFRNITKDLIKDSPVEKTYNSLKEDMSFKEKVGEQFRKVEDLSHDFKEKFSSDLIKKDIAKAYQGKQSEGLTASEYDKDYTKFMKGFLRDTPNKDSSATDLVKQFRKNNKSLGELYEPGQSKAYNRAKKDALLDYNKIIAETIEHKYPETEFSELFKFSNKRWSEIKDSELIDKFLDEIFKGKINFEKGKKFFNKDFQHSFKRALGEENYPKFETLMKDLMSTEQANKLLKTAEVKGYPDIVKTGLSYLVHPKLASGKVGFGYLKTIYKSLLDKPRLAVTWDEGIKAFKKGDFAKAQANFSILDKELTPKEKAFKSYKEKIN